MLPRYITKIEEEKKHYDNGTLKYECFWGVIRTGFEHLFDNRRNFKNDGFYRVRLKYSAKYKRNGEIEWKHIYNDNGELIQVVKQGHSSFKLRQARGI